MELNVIRLKFAGGGQVKTALEGEQPVLSRTKEQLSRFQIRVSCRSH